MLKGLYQDILVDHYKHPRNTAGCAHPSVSAEQYNQACGDSVTFAAEINDDTLVAVCMQARGCVISVATASLLSENIKNKKIEDVQNLTSDDVLALIGMQLGPIRLKCALLPLYAVHEALADYKK